MFLSSFLASACDDRRNDLKEYYLMLPHQKVSVVAGDYVNQDYMDLSILLFIALAMTPASCCAIVKSAYADRIHHNSAINLVEICVTLAPSNFN